MLRTTKITNQELTTTTSWIWGGDHLLEMVLLSLGSDSITVRIENNGIECMLFDLSTLKSVHKVDSSFATSLPIYAYSPTRWCINFRHFGGIYPEGSTGVRIGLNANTGVKTLDSAIIFWKAKTTL